MNSPDTPRRSYERLRTTPDFDDPAYLPTPDEVDEFKTLWAYEQSLKPQPEQPDATRP